MRENLRFAQLWWEGAVGWHAEDRKIIRHPDIGEITVDCDVLSDSDTDLKIVIYTTVPGSEDEVKARPRSRFRSPRGRLTCNRMQPVLERGARLRVPA
jgi:hypothetical protein